jgi:hypothetical protein
MGHIIKKKYIYFNLSLWMCMFPQNYLATKNLFFFQLEFDKSYDLDKNILFYIEWHSYRSIGHAIS